MLLICVVGKKKEIGPRINLYIYDTHYHIHCQCAFNLSGDEDSSVLVLLVLELCMLLCSINRMASIRKGQMIYSTVCIWNMPCTSRIHLLTSGQRSKLWNV